MDNEDLIYGYNVTPPFNKNRKKQHNVALKMIDDIRGTSKEKLYQQLGLEPLQQRKWYRTLYYFSKFLKINLFKISSKEKLYQQLDLQSLQRTFFNIFKVPTSYCNTIQC